MITRYAAMQGLLMTASPKYTDRLRSGKYVLIAMVCWWLLAIGFFDMFMYLDVTMQKRYKHSDDRSQVNQINTLSSKPLKIPKVEQCKSMCQVLFHVLINKSLSLFYFPDGRTSATSLVSFLSLHGCIQKVYQTVKNNVLRVDKHQIPFSEKSLSKNVCEILFVT